MGLNQMLMKVTPRFAVRWFASPYIAGESRAEALDVVDALWANHHVRSTIDLLGEAVRERAQVEANMAEYGALIGALPERPHAKVSVKLSAMGQDIDEAWCVENADALIRQARGVGTVVRVTHLSDHARARP